MPLQQFSLVTRTRPRQRVAMVVIAALVATLTFAVSTPAASALTDTRVAHSTVFVGGRNLDVTVTAEYSPTNRQWYLVAARVHGSVGAIPHRSWKLNAAALSSGGSLDSGWWRHTSGLLTLTDRGAVPTDGRIYIQVRALCDGAPNCSPNQIVGERHVQLDLTRQATCHHGDYRTTVDYHYGASNRVRITRIERIRTGARDRALTAGSWASGRLTPWYETTPRSSYTFSQQKVLVLTGGQRTITLSTWASGTPSTCHITFLVGYRSHRLSRSTGNWAVALAWYLI